MSTTADIPLRIVKWQEEVSRLMVLVADAAETENEELDRLKHQLEKAKTNLQIWKETALSRKEHEDAFAAFAATMDRNRQERNIPPPMVPVVPPVIPALPTTPV